MDRLILTLTGAQLARSEQVARSRGSSYWSSSRTLAVRISPTRRKANARRLAADQLARPPDPESLKTLARRIEEVHAEPVCAVVESMTGARLVHDTPRGLAEALSFPGVQADVNFRRW